MPAVLPLGRKHGVCPVKGSGTDLDFPHRPQCALRCLPLPTRLPRTIHRILHGKRTSGTVGERAGHVVRPIRCAGNLGRKPGKERGFLRWKRGFSSRMALQLAGIPPLEVACRRSGGPECRRHLFHPQRQQSCTRTCGVRCPGLPHGRLRFSPLRERLFRSLFSRSPIGRTDVFATVWAVVLRNLFTPSLRRQCPLHVSRQCALGASGRTPTVPRTQSYGSGRI